MFKPLDPLRKFLKTAFLSSSKLTPFLKVALFSEAAGPDAVAFEMEGVRVRLLQFDGVVVLGLVL